MNDNEFENFGLIYVMMMRDPAIKTFVKLMQEGTFNFSNAETAEAFATMTQAQRQAAYELVVAAVDVSMFSWIAITGHERGLFTLVSRYNATKIGLSSMTERVDLNMTKPMEWINKHSEFPYAAEENPWTKYGWSGDPGDSLN